MAKKTQIKTIVKDLDKVIVERITVPHDLTRQQYVELRMGYMTTIVKSKIALKKSFDIYKEQLGEVMSHRRRLNEAENRLVEVFERLGME